MPLDALWGQVYVWFKGSDRLKGISFIEHETWNITVIVVLGSSHGASQCTVLLVRPSIYIVGMHTTICTTREC